MNDFDYFFAWWVTCVWIYQTWEQFGIINLVRPKLIFRKNNISYALIRKKKKKKEKKKSLIQTFTSKYLKLNIIKIKSQYKSFDADGYFGAISFKVVLAALVQSAESGKRSASRADLS